MEDKFDDDVDRHDDEVHDRALKESASALATSVAVPFRLDNDEHVKAGFAVQPKALNALINKSTLKHVAGNSAGTIASTVEITKDNFRISVSSAALDTRATWETGTFIADAGTEVVSFGIDLTIMAKIASLFTDAKVCFALIKEDDGDCLKVWGVDDRGKPKSTILRLSVATGTAPSLLQGLPTYRCDIGSPTAFSKAISLCRTARPTSRKGDWSIEMGEGICAGLSFHTIVLVRDPCLPDLGAPIPVGQARKIALAVRNMDSPKLYDTDSSIIIADGVVEMAMKRSGYSRRRLEDVVSRFVEQDTIKGSMGDWKWSGRTTEVVNQYLKSWSRHGKAKAREPQIATIRNDSGSLGFNMSMPHVVADWGKNIGNKFPNLDPGWGAIDVEAASSVWWAGYDPREEEKPLHLSNCGTAIKMTIPSDFLEAYFELKEVGDQRFQTR